jgi:hypothetical protein
MKIIGMFESLKVRKILVFDVIKVCLPPPKTKAGRSLSCLSKKTQFIYQVSG